MVCLQRRTKFSDILRPIGGKCLRSVLTCLNCTKSNEIDISLLHIQNHVPNKKFYKKYKHYVYRLTQKFSDTLHTTGENI